MRVRINIPSQARAAKAVGESMGMPCPKVRTAKMARQAMSGPDWNTAMLRPLTISDVVNKFTSASRTCSTFSEI